VRVTGLSWHGRVAYVGVGLFCGRHSSARAEIARGYRAADVAVVVPALVRWRAVHAFFFFWPSQPSPSPRGPTLHPQQGRVRPRPPAAVPDTIARGRVAPAPLRAPRGSCAPTGGWVGDCGMTHPRVSPGLKRTPRRGPPDATRKPRVHIYPAHLQVRGTSRGDQRHAVVTSTTSCSAPLTVPPGVPSPAREPAAASTNPCGDTTTIIRVSGAPPNAFPNAAPTMDRRAARPRNSGGRFVMLTPEQRAALLAASGPRVCARCSTTSTTQWRFWMPPPGAALGGRPGTPVGAAAPPPRMSRGSLASVPPSPGESAAESASCSSRGGSTSASTFFQPSAWSWARVGNKSIVKLV